MIAEPNPNRWPITDEQRQALVESVYTIATTPGDPREQMAAARILVSMEGQNQTDDHDQVADEACEELRQRILAIARRHGVDL